METIVRLGLDTSKSVFQVHGVDGMEQPVLRRKLRRGQVLAFFSRLPPALVALEACGGSHYLARDLRSLGHEVAMIPPQYAKAYVQRGKSDVADAEAICEAGESTETAQELCADQESRAARCADVATSTCQRASRPIPARSIRLPAYSSGLDRLMIITRYAPARSKIT